jgi:quercetin dioxygenase-like cupin family protein
MTETVLPLVRARVGRGDDSQIVLQEEAKSAPRPMARALRRETIRAVIVTNPRQGGTTMIRTGDTLTNPVTGERLHFVTASADTDGEYVVVDVELEPNGTVAAAHVHPFQTETFAVTEGTVAFKVDGKTVTLGPGEIAHVEPGQAHKFWNAGETRARFRCVVTPALQFEQLIETMFTLAADGKTNRKGLPNPLRLAVIAKAHFDDVRLPFPPAWLQRLGLAMGAPLGRLVGYGPTYEAAAPSDAHVAI